MVAVVTRGATLKVASEDKVRTLNSYPTWRFRKVRSTRGACMVGHWPRLWLSTFGEVTDHLEKPVTRNIHIQTTSPEQIRGPHES